MYKLGSNYQNWTETLIDNIKDDAYFVADYGFNGLSGNANFNWTEKLVDKFQKYIYWRGLSGNKSFKPSLSFLKKYKSNWDWESWFGYNYPDYIVWDDNNLKEFGSEVIPHIRLSKFVQWNAELIKKYADYFFIDLKKKYGGNPILPDISDNKYIFWNNEIIQKYFNRIDWKSISKNENFPFTINLIRQAESKLDFQNLSKNKGINCLKK